MAEVLTRAGCFVAIIFMGYLLRRIGFFKEEDFNVLSKIVLKITLPAAIVSSFGGTQIDLSMLTLSLLGLGFGVLYMAVMYGINFRASKEKKAFEVLNTSGYNIGNFTMPFAQSFLGPVGVIATSLFDTGNAFICLGGANSIACAIKGDSGKISIKKILFSLSKSVAFDCYIVMVVMAVLNIKMPQPILSFAGIIGNANAFMAMLMIGVGFKLSGDRAQIGEIVKMLSVRYGIAIVLAMVCFNMLPFSLEVRQALAILVFSPIASAAPAFTADMHGDVGLASAVNSISIVCSILCIVTVLSIVL